MTKSKKNVRPVAGTTRRAKAETAARQAAISTFNCTTAAAGRQTKIFDILGYGPGRGLTISDLRRLTGLDPRTIRMMIRDERMSGAQIVSDNVHGYYVTDDPGEVQRFAQSMRRRAREIVQVAAAVEKATGRRNDG